MSQKKKQSGKGTPAIGAFISFGDVVSTSSSDALSAAPNRSIGASSGANNVSNVSNGGSNGEKGERGERGMSRGDLQPVYSGLDSDVTVISKKILKKDSTTKLKAFNELIILLNNPDKKSCIPDFIPYFIYVYLRLSLDNDRKLRELLNIALLSIIINAAESEAEERRVLGPYMKAIIGHLWVNQSDSCGEVARAAIKAFNRAVPADKRIQRLAALSPFILKHVSRNLASKPEVISDMGQSTPDEAEDRFERVIVASLSSIGRLARMLTVEPGEGATLDPSISESQGYKEVLDLRFWTHISTHKNILIRRASYDLISTMCLNAPDAIYTAEHSAEHSSAHTAHTASATNTINALQSANVLSLKKISSIFCSFLGETNAQNVPSMFLAFLSFIKCFPRCFQVISLDKQLVPKLKGLLESCPVSTLDALLPIFGSIPPETIAMFLTAEIPSAAGNQSTTATIGAGAGTAATAAAAMTNQSTTAGADITIEVEDTISPPISDESRLFLRGRALRSNQCLSDLLSFLKNMVERRTFPEDLLVSADLCMLECATLLLLRRTNVNAVIAAGGLVREEGEKGEGGEGGDDKEEGDRGKGKGKNKKSKKKDVMLSATEGQEVETDGREVEMEGRVVEKGGKEVPNKGKEEDKEEIAVDERDIEGACQSLCLMIVESIALIITATSTHTATNTKSQKSTKMTDTARTRSTDRGTEDSITYAPYTAMCRVLVQLQRASSLGINLTPSEWGLFLWAPLGVALDRLTHSHLLKSVVLGEGVEGGAEGREGGREGRGNDCVEGGEQGRSNDYYPNPIDEEEGERDGTLDMEREREGGGDGAGEGGEGGQRGKKNSGTKKQRQRVSDEEVGSLICGITAHTVLIGVVADVVRVVTAATAAAAATAAVNTSVPSTAITSQDNKEENVDEVALSDVSIDLCTVLLNATSNRLTLFASNSDSGVRGTAQTAFRSNLTALSICDLLKFTPTSLSSSQTSSPSSSIPASIPSSDALLSGWLIPVCLVLQMTEADAHPLIVDKLSQLYDAFLLSLHNTIPTTIPTTIPHISDNASHAISSKRTDACLAVLTHCFAAQSMRALNICLSSPLCSSMLTPNPNLASKTTPNQSTEDSFSSVSLRNTLYTLALAILGKSDEVNVAERKDKDKEEKIEKNKEERNVDKLQSDISSVNTSDMVDKSSLSDRVRFASLCALSAVGVTDALSVVGVTDVLSRALSVWRESRSKIGMWVVLTVIRQRLYVGDSYGIVREGKREGREKRNVEGMGGMKGGEEGEGVDGWKEGGKDRGDGRDGMENDLPVECADMLLSAFFSREDVYRIKSLTSNTTNPSCDSSLPVITSWEEVKNILLQLLPVGTQRKFSRCVLESLSLKGLFRADKTYGGKGGERDAERDGGKASSANKDNEENNENNENKDIKGVSFMPRKWARHMSRMMALADNGLSICENDEGNEWSAVSRVVAAVGFGDAQCWSALTQTASILSSSLSSSQSSLSSCVPPHPSLPPSIPSYPLSDSLVSFLNKSEYLLHALLQLNELWLIEGKGSGGREGRRAGVGGGAVGGGRGDAQWLPVAYNAHLLEELLVSLVAVNSFCAAVSSLLAAHSSQLRRSQSSHRDADIHALILSVHTACAESVTLCVCFLQDASSHMRASIAIQLLNNAYLSSSSSSSSLSSSASARGGSSSTSSTTYSSSSSSASASSLLSTGRSGLSTPNTHRQQAPHTHSAAVIASVSQCVLSACLTHSAHTHGSTYSAKNKARMLSKLLRVHTLHTENVPEKGATVWYLQHKAVSTYGKYGGSGGERTVRMVQMIEALEGKLVGIHREGKEYPFYTVSLAAPIHGSAGNTVREVQTNAYRILLSPPSPSLFGEYLHLTGTDSTFAGTNSTYADLKEINYGQCTYTCDTVEEYAVSGANRPYAPLNYNTTNQDEIQAENREGLLVEEATLMWLDNALNDIVTHSDVYHKHNANRNNNSLQLDVVCAVLRTICCQLVLLERSQSEANISTNFSDTHTNNSGINFAAAGVTYSNAITDTNNDTNNCKYSISTHNSSTVGYIKIGIPYLRGIATQVLSRYRGAVVHLLSGDATKQASRARTGLSLLSTLLFPLGGGLGAGCGLWLPEVLRLIYQALRSIKTSGSLVISREEKKEILSSICHSLAGLLRICGGRWNAAREVSGEALLAALPLLAGDGREQSEGTSATAKSYLLSDPLSTSVICLLRYTSSERLPHDSSFLPHLKEKSAGGGVGGGVGGGGGRKESGVPLSVEGQWVGGTLGGATPAAVAAAQRLKMSVEGALCEWESVGLRMCLGVISDRVSGIEGRGGGVIDEILHSSLSDGGGSNISHNNINSNNNSSSSSNNSNNSNSDSVREDATIAVHALLLGRTREAAGNIIMKALSTTLSTVTSDGRDGHVGGNTGGKGDNNFNSAGNSDGKSGGGEMEGGGEKMDADESRESSSSNCENELARRLMDVVSRSYTTHTHGQLVVHTPHTPGSNLVRLVAAKVLDVWYSAGGGISAELLLIEDKAEGDEQTHSHEEGDEGVEGEEEGDGGDSVVPKDYKEEEEEESIRCEKAFHSLIGVDTSNEIYLRLRESGRRGGGGGPRRGRKKGNNSNNGNNGNKGSSKEKERGDKQVIARGTFIPVVDHVDGEEEGEMIGDEGGEDDNDDDEEETVEETLEETEGERDGERVGEDTLGTLLQWLLCLQKIDSLAGRCFSLRARCGMHLKKTGSLKRAMMMFMRLVPDLVKQRDLPNAFQKMEGVSRDEISRLAAYCLFRTVCVLPAMVRSFWSDDCSRVSKQLLGEFISLRVKASLVAREVKLIDIAGKANRWDPEELQVKGSTVSGEITAVFCREDTKIELRIRLPPTYPLCNVEVECTGKSGVKDGRWRRWVLQIVQLLASQDGSVIDAVLLWKSNLEKEFEGVEPCPICYSIIHPKTFSLPALTCPTCNNKFHSTCLYTWFKSSGKSKCVICQQPIFR